MNKFIPFLTAGIMLTFTALRAQNLSDNRSITVTGEATVYVVPDEVQVKMGVESRNFDLGVARKKNEETIAKALGYIKSLGIEDKYIQTDYIFISPEYEYREGKQHLIGYIVRKNLVVTLKDLVKFDALVSGSLDQGVNVIHRVKFSTSKLREHRDKARDMAVKAAKEKAVAMSAPLDAEIAYVTSIQEYGGRWWNSYDYDSWGGYSWDRGMAQNAVQNAGGSAPESDSLAPGQIAVDASVTVTFALKSTGR